MGGHAALRGQDALRGVHADDVLGRGLRPDQDHLLAALGPRLGLLGREDDLAHRRARRSRQAARDHRRRLRSVDRRMQQLVEGVGVDAQDRLFARDQPLARHVDGDAHGGARRALAAARLQHPELAALDRELDVLHVAVVLLEPLVDRDELAIGLRHLALERRQVLRVRGAAGLVDRLRRADAGDDVLALGVLQVLAVEDLRSPVEGLRVKATPVAQSSPMLPKTMDWTLTAVPQSSGMSFRRR